MIDESERQREGLASVDLDQKDLQVGTRGRGGRCYVLVAAAPRLQARSLYSASRTTLLQAASTEAEVFGGL